MAAGGSSANIALGPGRLWYAPIGTAEPTSASAALPSAWQAVGYTEEGTEVEIESTVDEIEVAEELDPVLYANSKRTTKLSLEMAEPTRKRLALVMGGGASEVDTAASLEPPDTGTEQSVMLVWDSKETAAANAANVRWVFRSAKPSGTVTIARKKSPDKSTIPVEFMVQKPATAKPFIIFPNSLGQI
jgi:hypothetical protein